MLPFATTRTYCLRAGCCAGAVLAIAIARSPAQVAPTAPAAHWTVSGRCLGDEGGAPLAGCTIVVEGFQATGYPLAWSWLDWRDPEPVVTGGDGRFTFTLSVQPGRGFGDGYPSRIHLTIRAPGRVGVFGTRHLSTFFDHAAQDFGDFRLPRGVAPHVRVVDSAGVLQRDVELRVTAHSQRRRVAEPDREPAPGGDWWWFERNLAARTDAQGQALDDTPLDPGRYGLKVGNRSVRSGDGTFVIADPVAATAPITVVVEPVPVAQTAAGRVVDGDDHPVAGYVLYAVGKAKDTRNVEWITTRTIADGSFLLVAAGKNLNDDFELKHPRNNRYDEWQSFGGQVWGKQGLLIKLARRASLQLAVTAVGIGPITDLAVQALPVDPLLPGADPVRLSGTFTGGIVCIDNLRKGRYLVRVHARGSDLWPSPWRECEASAEPTLVPIELPAPVARTLHVFTDQGRPVVGGRVELVFGAKAPGNSDQDVVHRTMVEPTTRGGRTGIIASAATTDASGKVVLRGLSTDGPVFVRVQDGGAQRSVQELPSWSAGHVPILITVPAGAEVTGRIAPADFVTRLDVSSKKARDEAAKFGIGSNPWHQSLADLQRSNRAALALRLTGEQQTGEHVAPIADDGTFAIHGVPPGRYDVLLVLRERHGDRTQEHPLDEPLATITLVAGETARLDLRAPREVVEQDR